MDSEELEAEGRDLVALAADKALCLRLLGGVAVRLTCPSARLSPFDRACGDIDFAARGRAGEVEAFFLAGGWSPDAEFNLYNGGERLIFRKERSKRRGDSLGGAPLKADVFLGDFRMCHRIGLDGRLDADPLALPLAELLLTKLQVVQANDKDLGDAASILLDHGLGRGDGPCIDSQAFMAPCSSDWGLWRTATASLKKVAVWANAHVGDQAALGLISKRGAELLDLLASSRKTLAWKARAALGESIRWYELPEEVDR